MKKVFRQLAQNWTPITSGQEVPDFGMMKQLAFGEHDNTKFENPSTFNINFDHLKTPTGHGAASDDPHTAHFIGGMLRDIHPELGHLYFGGAANSQPKTEYHSVIHTHRDVKIMHPHSFEDSPY